MDRLCDLCKLEFDGVCITLPCCGFRVCKKHLDQKVDSKCDICSNNINVDQIFDILKNKKEIERYEKKCKKSELINEYLNLKKIKKDVTSHDSYCNQNLKEFIKIIDLRKDRLVKNIYDYHYEIMSTIEIARAKSVKDFQREYKLFEKDESKEIEKLLKDNDNTKKESSWLEEKLKRIRNVKNVLEIKRNFEFHIDDTNNDFKSVFGIFVENSLENVQNSGFHESIIKDPTFKKNNINNINSNINNIDNNPYNTNNINKKFIYSTVINGDNVNNHRNNIDNSTEINKNNNNNNNNYNQVNYSTITKRDNINNYSSINNIDYITDINNNLNNNDNRIIYSNIIKRDNIKYNLNNSLNNIYASNSSINSNDSNIYNVNQSAFKKVVKANDKISDATDTSKSPNHTNRFEQNSLYNFKISNQTIKVVYLNFMYFKRVNFKISI